jgi:hypothetical protein
MLCKLGVLLLLVISLLVMVHSLASNVTINNPSNFNSQQIPTSGLTDGNSSVPIPAGQTEPATMAFGNCLFQRFSETVRSFVNFRSVFPYVYIAIILFNLIFNPFLIIWVLISPIIVNIVGSTTTCYIFPVSSSSMCP